MNRRNLVSMLSAAPLVGLFTAKAKAEPQEALTGLAARRQEAIDLFTLGLDKCIEAERDTNKFQPLSEPAKLELAIEVTYGNEIKIRSCPAVVFSK